MLDMLDSVAHAIMKAADNSQKQSEPKYAIEMFDTWLDCRELALAAIGAYEEESEKLRKAKDKFYGQLANEAEADERF